MPRRSRIWTPNHARTSIYTVTRNERFAHHFLVSPNLITEDKLQFVYNDGKSVITKIVPIKVVMQNAKPIKFFGRDPETLRSVYNGYAYEVPSSVIETYKG